MEESADARRNKKISAGQQGAGPDSGNEKDPWDIDIQACSATDCTGLIPSLPESEAQIEMYQDLFPYMAKTETPGKEAT